MFYTYVLRCCDGDLYIGYSNNLRRRILEHVGGKVDATRPRLPVTLIYYEACLSREGALAREKYFKTGFGRRFLKSRI